MNRFLWAQWNEPCVGSIDFHLSRKRSVRTSAAAIPWTSWSSSDPWLMP